jgi:hypothetical protein
VTAAVEWVADHAAEPEADPERLLVADDSQAAEVVTQVELKRASVAGRASRTTSWSTPPRPRGDPLPRRSQSHRNAADLRHTSPS